MSYFLAGYNKETGNWDVLDHKVREVLEEALQLRAMRAQRSRNEKLV